jgi:putative transposase
LVTDQYWATLKAIKQVTKDGLMDLKAHQCSKYRNNLIEQDHQFIKRHRFQSAGFKNMHTTASTLAGVEVIHAMRKQTRRNRSLFGFSVINELKQMLAA